MRYIYYTFFFLISCFLVSVLPVKAEDILIKGVHIITMKDDKVLRNQNVLIQDGKIAYIGKKSAKAGKVVNAQGQYLLPGLMDMHVHLFSDDIMPREAGLEELKVILSNGVTSVRLMNGYEHHLQWRGKIKTNQLLGPNLYVTSPEIVGRKYTEDLHGHLLTEPAQADSVVRAIKKEGYEFVKITVDVSLPVYNQITATAKEVGIPVIGHVGPKIKLINAIKAGQQIEHLDQFLDALLKDGSSFTESISDFNLWKKDFWPSIFEVDTSKISGIVQLVKEHNVYNTPTSNFLQNAFGYGMDSLEILSRPDYTFTPASRRPEYWRRRSIYFTRVNPTEDMKARYLAIRKKIVKELHTQGCKLMAGSDTPDWFYTYGFSLHRELEEFVKAGLTPYQALETATINPARYLNVSDQYGTVEVGKVADLVLLSANPLESVGNSRKINAVVKHGRYLDTNELQQMLEKAKGVYEAN
jgi:imidazolonepropionase-like amidohydrolase